jgi:2'-hydroxyisoflavone reductase
MNRRDLLKLGVVAGVGAIVSRIAGQTSQPPARPRIAVPAAEGVVLASKPLRILILGGTGFIGPHQVRYALARGHKLTLFNRGRRPKEWPGEVEELTGDRDAGDLKALEGREWDVCIDNPTSLPFWVRDAGRVLVGHVKQYVFISTLSVLADTSQPGLDETAPVARYTGRDAMAETRATLMADVYLYGPLKAVCEAEAEKCFPGATTIVRPTLIVGPGDDTDRFTYWPVRIARGGEVLAPPADDPVQFIDARDLAEWTVRLVEQGALGIFTAAGPGHELRVAAMMHDIHAATGSDAKFIFASNRFLREQSIEAWSDLPAWVPGEGESAGFARVSNARAIASGLKFRPLAATAADTLAWFNALPDERRTRLRAGLTAERETAALAAWHARNS